MGERDGRSPVERFLNLFAEVRAGEAAIVLLLALNIFFIFTAYYILKVVREPLILLGGVLGFEGATLKAAATAGQALLLLGAVPAYGALAGRVDRMRLINIVTVIFVGCLVAFNVLAHAGAPIGLAFFIWLGIFNMMLPATFWSFANDVYTVDEGKRLFAIVAFGGTFGAVVGAWLAGVLIEIEVFKGSPQNLMLVSGGLLLVAVVVTNIVHRRKGTAGADDAASQPPMSRAGGFQLVFKKRYLLYIALMVLVFTTVNSDGEFILGALITEKAKAAGQDEEQIIGQFYSGFYTWVNIATAFLQLFVVSRIIKYLDVRAALLFLPLAALGGSAAVLFLPVLSFIRAAKIVENSVDYSLQNTVRHALFLPTDRAEKYKAKQAIDSFFVRMGDVLSFGVVFVLTALMGLGIKFVALANVVLIGVWLLLIWGIARHHRKLVGAS